MKLYYIITARSIYKGILPVLFTYQKLFVWFFRTKNCTGKKIVIVDSKICPLRAEMIKTRVLGCAHGVLRSAATAAQHPDTRMSDGCWTRAHDGSGTLQWRRYQPILSTKLIRARLILQTSVLHLHCSQRVVGTPLGSERCKAPIQA